jgi:hypothetical protein
MASTMSSHDAPGPGGGDPLSFDVSVAHPARVYDYWLGGKDNYEADREAAEQVIAANPGVLPGVRANRAFLRRAVEHLVNDIGVRQFLDIGTGLPTADNTHEVAQASAPDARIVYVDNDPIVLAHARALLTSTPEGATAYVHADAREPGKILGEAAGLLDFSQPVAVMALMVLQYIPDDDEPHQIMRAIMEAVPSGSYLVVSDTTRDINTEQVAESSARLNQRMGGTRQTRRSRDEIASFFDGLTFVDPGLVPLPQWRTDAAAQPGVAAYAGVARKP